MIGWRGEAQGGFRRFSGGSDGTEGGEELRNGDDNGEAGRRRRRGLLSAQQRQGGQTAASRPDERAAKAGRRAGGECPRGEGMKVADGVALSAQKRLAAIESGAQGRLAAI